MRPILLVMGLVVATLAASVSAASAATAPRPWCIRGGVMGAGMWDCTYHNLQQCLASANGNGGTCVENPNYRGSRNERRPARERRY
jgi:hypothetical protein